MRHARVVRSRAARSAGPAPSHTRSRSAAAAAAHHAAREGGRRQVMVHDRSNFAEAVTHAGIVAEGTFKLCTPPCTRFERHILIQHCRQPLDLLVCWRWLHETQQALCFDRKRLESVMKIVLLQISQHEVRHLVRGDLAHGEWRAHDASSIFFLALFLLVGALSRSSVCNEISTLGRVCNRSFIGIFSRQRPIQERCVCVHVVHTKIPSAPPATRKNSCAVNCPLL